MAKKTVSNTTTVNNAAGTTSRARPKPLPKITVYQSPENQRWYYHLKSGRFIIGDQAQPNGYASAYAARHAAENAQWRMSQAEIVVMPSLRQQARQAKQAAARGGK